MNATVIGEVVIDRFIYPDGTVVDVPGGSAANTAIALHRSGVDTALRARFSVDAAGRALRAHVAAEHLDLAAAPDVDEPASVVEVRPAADGQPAYVFHLQGAADWHWTASELATPLPVGTALVHAGSLAAVLEPGSTHIREWLKSLGQRPLVSFDPNARPAAATSDADAAAMRDGVEAWCRIADFIKVSDEDLRWLAPTTAEAVKAAEWSLHTAFVVMTRGAAGAAVFVDGKPAFEVASQPVDVIDTVGAGDTFMAWLIKGVLEALQTQTLDALAHSHEALRAIVERAGRAAAINCSRRGCNPPYRTEV